MRYILVNIFNLTNKKTMTKTKTMTTTKTMTNTFREDPKKERHKRPVTFETFNQSDEGT